MRSRASCRWLPLVLALSANSPYLAGERDRPGLARAAEVLALLPRASRAAGLRLLRGVGVVVERFVRIGLADGYTRFWWDIRPHPRFGTLEVRAPDQPTAVELTAVFAALLQALCVTVLEGAPPAPANRGDYAQNRWAALRFGPRAELIHPDGERLVGVEELTHELLALIEPAVSSSAPPSICGCSTRGAARATASSRSAVSAGSRPSRRTPPSER